MQSLTLLRRDDAACLRPLQHFPTLPKRLSTLLVPAHAAVRVCLAGGVHASVFAARSSQRHQNGRGTSPLHFNDTGLGLDPRLAVDLSAQGAGSKPRTHTHGYSLLPNRIVTTFHAARTTNLHGSGLGNSDTHGSALGQSNALGQPHLQLREVQRASDAHHFQVTVTEAGAKPRTGHFLCRRS